MTEFIIDGERTRPIKGYESRYAVTESGKIVSFRKDGTYKFLALHPTERGYLKIKLSKNGKYITKKIHRIVIEAFKDIDIDRLHIDHIDGNKLNNHYTNLRWCTNKENNHYYHQSKYSENWDPRPIRTREEIEQRRLNIEKHKQERIDAMLYGSREEMMKHVSKPIIVNDVEYRSIKEAARYIAEQEPGRKYETIRTELKKMNGGKRKPGTMYGRYCIELVKK